MSAAFLTTYHTGYLGTDPLKLAFNGSGGASAAVAVPKKGIYVLTAEAQPAVVKLGPATPSAAALPTSQDASQKGALYLPAGVPTPVEIPDATTYVAALGSTATGGVLYIVGPLHRGSVRG